MAGTSISNFGDRQQIWNLGNNIIDTKNLVDLEMTALEMKKTPYSNEKNQLSQDKLLYTSLKSEFKSFTQTFKDLAAFKGNEKKVTTSQDGYINVKADSNAIAGTFHLQIMQLAQRHQISSAIDQTIDMNEKIGVDDTLQIGDEKLKVTADMTYKDFINRINDGNYGVSAYTLGGRIFISANKEGTQNAIRLEDGASKLFQKLGFYKEESGTKIMNTVPGAEALDAKFSINGIEDTSPTNTIEALPGVKIELLKETEGKAGDQPTEIKFTVSDSNITDAANMIKKMVAEYNKAVSTEDIFAGKGGAFQGQSIMQSIRQIMNDVVTFSQDGNYLFTFGIQIKQDGTLQVDDEKLTKTLKEKPDVAKQFFFSSKGLGKMMEEPLDKLFGDKGVVAERVKNIDSRVSDLDKKINDIDIQNQQKQDDIIKKYQKLESTLALLDSQLKTIKAMTKQKSDD
ncbi:MULTISPECIES: flagellar hook-associated protein 2 [Bacillus cereus group]|uniref:flagellar hook-associated protein 2 n=1 Tax=Bacillus cereus group TaxID=86661 RepID=UPI00086456FF|nr:MULTISPECIES: flagellar hook-associated protein 2 [Bacillus cereus group]AWC28293.1 flagellar filament capping protein FliD [Bacillus cytotoxicus]AWC40322.1 flagellar filament capping protein FliD [Bacillus cytotoxicus]AWC48253.1 flagellar filament capping protein FliD [Bacillus cytotoxicus]AWC52360.1 flagellar filament capping protein FliD [Bacillus cytotoxicus]AWC56494.1 flagellar filament capping protein FliD [Bacillus cytotoxicus]